eukprot:XP_003729789.1 PREDICTED: uncharacterized protein LOC100894070 [Strongylocentrotus purpuratus]
MSPSIVGDPALKSTTSRPSLRHRVRRRWGRVVVVATFALYFVLYGILFSYSLLFVAFQEEFKSSATLTGWVGSIPLSISLMLAPFIKLASERFGYRSVSIFGIVLASVGVFVTSFLPSLLPMFGTYGLMAGVGTGIVTVCAFDLIVLYFPEKNTMRAVAIAVTGSTAGMLALTQVMALLITNYGWRITLRIMGALLLAVGLPCVLTYTLPSDHYGNRKTKNRYCKVITKQDDYAIDRIAEAMPDDLDKCPLIGLRPSPSKMDRECNSKLIPGSLPAYILVDGLGENRESLLLDEEQRADDTTVMEKSVDDRSLISDACSEDKQVVEKAENAKLDDKRYYHQLTSNCDVSYQTPCDESSNGDATVDVLDSEEKVFTMDQSRGTQQAWQSDDCSPANAARRYPINNDKELANLEALGILTSEKPLEDLQDPGMLRKIGRALTFPELWMISLATILNGIGDCFYYVNAINYLVSVGFTEQTGVQFVSFTALGILVGKVALIFIGEHLPFPRIFIQVISNVIGIIVWILLMIVRSVIPVYCTAIAAGISVAITTVVTYSLAPDFFGQERATETSAVIFFCYGTGLLLGSLVGQSIDNTGSYVGALWAFIGMYITSGIVLPMAPLYQRIFAPERFVTFDIHRRKREARSEWSRLRKKDRHRCTVSKEEIIVCELVSSV